MHFSKLQDLSLLVIRLILGIIFLYAGYSKWGFWTSVPEGVPALMANLLKFLSIVEPLGAVALLVGFLTRWAATGLAIIMVGAFFLAKFMMGASFFTAPQGSGLDYIVLIFAGCLALMAFGGGKFGLEGMKRK